ncbi:unnamed protein product [Ambrosiozyma monospora]|uniref:Unnamed protein product n=1 Tax=Ambrosiozyma monospora TaxID=43982 RepID=A0A9W6Z2T1_AMBMO|nr:unnamed protein product [Ambrosiozyma monospora]
MIGYLLVYIVLPYYKQAHYLIHIPTILLTFTLNPTNQPKHEVLLGGSTNLILPIILPLTISLVLVFVMSKLFVPFRLTCWFVLTHASTAVALAILSTSVISNVWTAAVSWLPAVGKAFPSVQVPVSVAQWGEKKFILQATNICLKLVEIVDNANTGLVTLLLMLLVGENLYARWKLSKASPRRRDPVPEDAAHVTNNTNIQVNNFGDLLRVYPGVNAYDPQILAPRHRYFPFTYLETIPLATDYIFPTLRVHDGDFMSAISTMVTVLKKMPAIAPRSLSLALNRVRIVPFDTQPFLSHLASLLSNLPDRTISVQKFKEACLLYKTSPEELKVIVRSHAISFGSTVSADDLQTVEQIRAFFKAKAEDLYLSLLEDPVAFVYQHTSFGTLARLQHREFIRHSILFFPDFNDFCNYYAEMSDEQLSQFVPLAQEFKIPVPHIPGLPVFARPVETETPLANATATTAADTESNTATVTTETGSTVEAEVAKSSNPSRRRRHKKKKNNDAVPATGANAQPISLQRAPPVQNS